MSGSARDNQESIEEQAARLLLRLFADSENGGADDAERAEICCWIDADPRHAVAFARAEMVWDQAERLKALPAESILPLTETSAEPILVESISADPAPATPPFKQQGGGARHFLAGGLIAASLFIAAAAVTVQKMYDVQRYKTEIGEVRDVKLADGSVMHLNSGTSTEVRYTDNGRRVRLLGGEASFNVAHDTARPFDVEAQSAVIRAVGTAFNVRVRPSMVELTVTEGVVAVRSGQSAAERVRAGAGAAIRPRTIALTKLDTNVIGQRMAWREQMVELDGDTVEQAVAEFNRYRKTPLVICDARVSALRIGGRFRTNESNEFLTALQLSLPVRVMPGDDGSVMLLYRDDNDIAQKTAGT